MPNAYFSIGDSRIHYSYFGAGRSLLFCFHGYGESAVSFEFLDEALAQEFIIVAIDLPFHGQTEWREARPLEPGELLGALEKLAAGIPGLSAGWSLLGYSMGGRIALQLLELASEKFRQVVLLAPDGLRVNPWYWLGTQTFFGNRIFRWTVHHPGWLFFVLRAGNFLRVVNPSVFKFTSHYIGDEQARQRLYERWTAMRLFKPKLPAIARTVIHRRIPVQLIYGSYDRIIRWERGERFQRSCASFCRLTVLTAGHQLLQPKFMEVIVNALYLPIV